MPDVAWTMQVEGLEIQRITLPIAVLRAKSENAAAVSFALQPLGLQLPTEPNTVADNAGNRILWMAPGEWMIVGRTSFTAEMMAQCQARATVHLAHVGEGRVVYELRGPLARDLLAKGCTLDLHPRVFGADRCAQSVLAQAFVLIERGLGDNLFHVYADASFAHHLELWFEDALVEFRHGEDS